MSSTMEDPNKPVTGYPPPPGYHPARPAAYPMAGTAYPYIAPPPAAYYNPTPYQPYINRKDTLFRRILITGIAVFLIMSAIVFIFWLVLRPRLPQFRVDSASVTHFNVSASQISANWDFGFSIRNPNEKMSVFYDNVGAVVLFGDKFLSETALAPFDQGKKNQTTLQTKFTAASAYLEERAVKVMTEDRSRGIVNFSVRLLATVRFKAGAWQMRRHFMRVSCDDVKVGFSSNGGEGTLLGGSKQCEVTM